MDRVVLTVAALCVDVTLVTAWVRPFLEGYVDTGTLLFATFTAGTLALVLLLASLKVLKKWSHLLVIGQNEFV